MSELPIIETPRMTLTVPGPKDADRMARFVQDNKSHLGPWEPIRPDHHYTTDYWIEHLDESIEESTREFRCGWCCWTARINRDPYSANVPSPTSCAGPSSRLFSVMAWIIELKGRD